MRLTFFGAAGEVTGSCTLVETVDARFLVDFGLFQGAPGAERRNFRAPRFDPKSLDAVVLTHAHIDHCGRLPLLPRLGFAKPIHATSATCDLAGIMLRDSASVQSQDAARLTRRRQRLGRREAGPLYTIEDVERALPFLRPRNYSESFTVAPGVTARFHDAGHIIGAAIVELTVREGGSERTIVFSGDIGPAGAALMRDPALLHKADAVILESTYGDRDHKPLADTLDELAAILASARETGGKILIPAFAVGRTQSLIYHLGALRREGRIAADTAVYIDSPMATSATALYARHREAFDDESWALIHRGLSPLDFPNLEFTRSMQDSQRLNALDGGVVVIAASGMCTGGRILHHFKHNLWKPQTRVVIVGFQAAGTLGRALVDGARRVSVMGDPVVVRASIHTLGGLSAHAGQRDLLKWASAFTPASRPRVFLNHGENTAREALRERLTTLHGMQVDLPQRDQTFDI